MSDQTPWPLIAKYLAGECSPEEKLAMEWWLDDYHNSQLFQQIKEAWQQEKQPDDLPDFDAERGLERLHTLISSQSDISLEHEESGKNMFRLPKINSWLTAASVLVLIGLGYLFVNKKTERIPVASVKLARQISGDTSIVNFRLPDGSKVWLNKNSKIEYPEAFVADQRVVYLEGEAFFEVTHNPEKPFIVRSEKVSTQVLGTSFNVKAYKGEEIASVSVATGKVEVSKEIESGSPIRITQLTPRQELVINTKKDETYIDIVNLNDIGAWRNEPLVFRNNTYAEVISKLEEHYAIKINVKDKNLANCRVMASFNEDATLNDVLKLLSISNAFQYTIDGKNVTIRGGECR